jgi:hypothetical protein
MTHHLSAEHITDEMRECIMRCSDCHNVCVETVTHCLTIGGEHAAVDHIRLLLDCAEICATSRDFMLRGSEHHRRTCGVCAEICDAYARWARGVPGPDEQMRRCGEECERCAESCRRMAG